MSLVRLTPEIYEKLSNSMGLSAQQIREAINSGSLVGQKAAPDSRIYLIDDKYIPKEEVAQKPVEVTGEAQTTLQKLDSQIEITKKQIQLDELNKVREKPELLKQKEQQLNDRQAELDRLKATLDEQKTSQEARELEIVGKLQRFDEQEKSLVQSEQDSLTGIKLKQEESTKILQDTEQQINDAVEETLTDFDVQILSRQDELLKLARQLKSADAKLLETKQAIEETKTEIVPLIKTLDKYKEMAMALYNQQHTALAKARQGSQEESYHHKHAENLWNIKDKLLAFKTKLNKFLG
jgi:chromosome segregation ATPase